MEFVVKQMVINKKSYCYYNKTMVNWDVQFILINTFVEQSILVNIILFYENKLINESKPFSKDSKF